MRVKLKIAMNLFTDLMKSEESESVSSATSSNKEFYENVSLKVTQMSVFQRLGIHIT